MGAVKEQRSSSNSQKKGPDSQRRRSSLSLEGHNYMTTCIVAPFLWPDWIIYAGLSLHRLKDNQETYPVFSLGYLRGGFGTLIAAS